VNEERDQEIRTEVFDYLSRRTALDPEGLANWSDLVSFRLADGTPLPLIGASGIWKPRELGFPISVTTAPRKPGHPAPYEDAILADGTVQYRYRDEGVEHRDNRGLRDLLRYRLPIVYFLGVEKGRYMAHFPTYVALDDMAGRMVALDIAGASFAGLPGAVAEGAQEALRRYRIVAVRQRVHQVWFRSQVLHAYRCRCAVCSLSRRALLDAAHIIEDVDPAGVAAVSNGLSLCKIHHSAYDQNLLGIDPDLRVHIARDLLEEIDGPMLQHGLKEMHGQKLLALPSQALDYPARDRLERRFQEFRLAQ
jgi:putative restriction endonuclease